MRIKINMKHPVYIHQTIRSLKKPTKNKLKPDVGKSGKNQTLLMTTVFSMQEELKNKDKF